ncbi:MAG TPA: HAMP domain-containing protein [Sedimenticola thiotaurini]|uniref:histidine kinase n=1 Tax=Sedimenticola thiotaurini TaxID=1543721 RepID=A0A831W2C2_9GAMM|nr:HAMP domain-containing protein [Sedimenticola thiotaurini]
MDAAALKRLGRGPLPVLVLLALVLASLHLMSSAVQNTEELNRLFVPLLIASLVGLVLLLGVIGINVAQLIIRYRQQAAGSRLTLHMMLIFVIISLAPVLVVFYYSQQFLMQGIDSWFDVQIDQAVEDAMELSRASLDLHKRERLKTTQRALTELTGSSVAGLAISLEELLDKYGATEMALLTPAGRPMVISNADPTVMMVPTRLDTAILQQVRGGVDFVGLMPTQGDESLLEVMVVVNDEKRGMLLQAMYPTSANISQLSETVQSAYNRYKELTFLRKSLKQTFTLALALVLLFGLLSAIWMAFYLARRLVAPITDIAEGTRAVAQGDYDMQLPEPRRRDELGFLVASFNEMTRRIAQARDEAARSKQQVEAQRSYLETVLGSLSSGVMALDADGRIQTANEAALEILRVDVQDYLGHQGEEMEQAGPLLRQFLAAVDDAIGEERRPWRAELTLHGGDGRRVLLCRGTPLVQPGGQPDGYVLVFDDITALIKAQRDAAWGEVARRLAHEIKNPLTPIQLSAERLRRKYLKRMAPEDARVLERATATIVQQVEAMKKMVNAFSDYARPPKLRPEPLALNGLVQEVIDLYRSAGMRPRLEVELARTDVLIEADPVRLRQVIHNLIKNAQEALAETEGALIRIATREVDEGGCRFVELRVEDNGPGFDDEVLAHLFEPYVTTKVKGTGLGLAIVRKIVEEHAGQVWAENREEGGGRIVLRLPAVTGSPVESCPPIEFAEGVKQA